MRGVSILGAHARLDICKLSARVLGYIPRPRAVSSLGNGLHCILNAGAHLYTSMLHALGTMPSLKKQSHRIC